MKKIILPAAILMSLSACSSDGDEIIFDTRLGPETSSQIQALPSGLQGDSENARYSRTDKKGTGMESDDGTEE